MCQRSLLSGILTALLTLLSAQVEAQQIKTWATPVDGAWSDPARWSPAGVPAASDFVEITTPGAYTVTLRGSGAAAFLTIGGAGGAPVLAVQGASAKGNASLRVSGGIDNAGTLRLESVEGIYAAYLTVAAGALVNRGAVAVESGSGGQRLFAGDLRNLGRFSVDAPLQFSKTGGVYLNAGEFIVAAGRTLSIAGASQVFHQQGGDLKVQGDLNLSSMTFIFDGGAIPEKSPLLLTTALHIGPEATGAATFLIRGRCTFSGDVAPGQTLWVNGATLSAASGFTNGGTLRLESSETSATASLVITSGTLVNQGRIALNRGAGGGRTLTGDLDNQGRIELETSAVLSSSGAGTYTNTGTIQIPAGNTLTINGGTLTSHAPGTIGGGGTLALNRLAFYGSGTVGADVAANQCDFYPGNPTGTLRIAGYCRLNALSSLNVEVAGTTPGSEYDRLEVAGQATLGGALKVAVIRDFRPTPCDQFTVLTYGSSAGRFASMTGLDLGDGLTLLTADLGGLALMTRLSWQRISLNPTALGAAEGGGARAYRVCVGQRPTAAVRITSSTDAQLTLAIQEAFFTPTAWQGVQELRVRAVDDDAAEGPHTAVVTHIAHSTDANFEEYPVASVAVEIADNDLGPGEMPALSLLDAEAEEGGRLVFSAGLTRASSLPVTVQFTTEDGSARAGSDYTALSGTLTFAPGETSKTVEVALADDDVREAGENLFLHLHGAANATLADDQAVGALIDGDPLPALRVGDVNASEGSGQLTFAITLTNPSSQTLSVDFATEDGTALSGHDYTAASGTLSFAPGQVIQWVNVSLKGDNQYEQDEDFHLVLSNPVNGALGDNRGRGGVLDDDPLPLLSIGNANVAEGNSSTVPVALTFAVALSNPSSRPVAVFYFTANGTAQAGRDYTAASGTLSFGPGETSKTIAVSILGDQLSEPDETLSVSLGNAVNADRGDAQAVGTILSDDALPTLSVAGDLAAAEGNAGSSPFAFTVNLSAASNQVITVLYATLDNTALAASDYVAAKGTLSFSPGQTTKQINVLVRGDLAFEGEEVFALNLHDPVNAVLGDGLALGTLRNDDPTPSLAVNDTTAIEGNSGTRQLLFRVRLSNPSSLPVGVSYTTADSTAQAGSDYTTTSGRLLFNPLETLKSLGVVIRGDAIHEGNETLVLLLSDPANASLSDALASGTILDDDALPVLSVADTAAAEGDRNPGQLGFALSLSATAALPVTVAYTLADSTAQAGSDYTAASGTLTFEPGETRKALSVVLNADRTYEADEALILTLADPLNATLGQARAIGILRNDDPLPTLSIADTATAEGDSTGYSLGFSVQLSNPSSQAIAVSFATLDSTAQAGSDYTAASGTLTFDPGQLRQTFSVPVQGDTLYEPDEFFAVLLSDPTNAALGRARATGTLRNDDPIPSLSIAETSASEGDQGVKPLTFTATLPAPLSAPLIFSLVTADGTALAGSDYVPTQSQLAFLPGETRKTFRVALLGDDIHEPDETLFVVLSDSAKVLLGSNRVRGTIVNDDPLPALSIADTAAAEGHSGIRPLTFVVTLTNPSSQHVTVSYATADGTARAGSDFLFSRGLLRFSPGQVLKTLNVGIRGDRTQEPGETFAVVLNKPVNASLARARATGTLLDDEGLAKPLAAAADNLGISAFPNPANPTTTLSYTLEEESAVRLVVCDVLGQQLRLLVDGRQPAGAYRVEWDGRDDQGRGVGTGIYFYRLEAGPRGLTGKLLLLR